MEEVLSRLKDRSDLRAQKEDVAAKKWRIRYQKGFYWPTADLAGQYYTQRSTFLQDVDWDVVLSVQVPLFQGGTVSAAVREAQAAYRQSVLVLEEMERRAAHAVRRTHGELSAAVRETQALDEAARAAQKSYDALLEEYRLGLVTNLDVLQALDLLQAQKNAREAARLKAKRLFIQLNVAVEKMP